MINHDEVKKGGFLRLVSPIKILSVRVLAVRCKEKIFHLSVITRHKMKNIKEGN